MLTFAYKNTICWREGVFPGTKATQKMTKENADICWRFLTKIISAHVRRQKSSLLTLAGKNQIRGHFLNLASLNDAIRYTLKYLISLYNIVLFVNLECTKFLSPVQRSDIHVTCDILLNCSISRLLSKTFWLCTIPFWVQHSVVTFILHLSPFCHCTMHDLDAEFFLVCSIICLRYHCPVWINTLFIRYSSFQHLLPIVASYN